MNTEIETEDVFKNVHKVHCIGIGGIGVSAFARMMLDKGKVVSGSDRTDSELIDKLIEEGVEFYLGHESENITEDIDLIVYSPAIPKDNKELLMAEEFGIKAITYPEALGMISESMFTIAISGTHGKTTTTAMVADVLIQAGLDPTVIVGSILKKYDSNYVAGKGSIFVVEACEYRRSFTHIRPDILVITNVEADHLDYYKDLDDIKSAFKEVIGNMKDFGVVVTNLCQESIGDIVLDAVVEVDDYSLLSVPEEIKLIGNHNYENAKAVLAVSKRLNISLEDFTKAIQGFKGTWRRTENRGELSNGAIWIDDYGHHPTEIKTTLKGIRDAYPDRTLSVIFEPHLHSRTKSLLTDFGSAFGSADMVYVLPIYEARVETDHSVSNADVVSEINKNGIKADVCNSFSECSERVLDETDEKTIVVTIGAGDVYKVFG